MAVGCIEPVPHDLPGDIELWRVDLDQYRYVPDAPIFSADELERAERFVFGDDRRRFLAAHHALRHVLGLALGRQPRVLAFEAGAHGKPRLLDAPGLEFNLSHSVHECLIGISARYPIGVDVEVVQRVVDADALARRHFTTREFEQWERAPAAGRERVFLQGWTRKEACLKALGVGVSVQPRRIEAGCDSGVRTVFAKLGPSRVKIDLVSIGLAGGTAIGAVAVADTAA
jgi:4'-phosphopantetheinyl transferase